MAKREGRAPTRGFDGLIERAAQAVRDEPEEFLFPAGHWLSDTYSEHAVRKRRGQSLAGEEGLPPSAYLIPGVNRGEDARLWRLAAARLDLAPDPGKEDPMAVGDADRVAHARRTILVACLSADARACEYARFLTDLGDYPWQAEDGLGRAYIEWNEDQRMAWADLLERSLTVLEAEATRREAMWKARPPEVALQYALLEIYNAFQPSHFRQLIEGRRRRSEMTLNLLNALAQSHPDEAMEEADRPPKDAFPKTFIGHLQYQLRLWERGCDRALAALDAGGGQALNDAMTPGSRRRTVEVGARIGRARMTAFTLRHFVVDPAGLIEDNVAELEGHAAWLRDVRDEFEAALRQRGPSPEEAGGAGSSAGPAKAVKGWTRSKLIEATSPAIGGTTFWRIQKAAKIRAGARGRKGRLFTPQEVRRMLAVIDDEAPQTAALIRAAWEKLLAAAR